MQNGVYKITNLINGKFYYGSTKNIRKRFISHKVRLNNQKHENNHLQKAWNKYGEPSFRFEVIARCEDDSDLVIVEQFFLDRYWDGGKTCYNIGRYAGRAMTGRKHSQKSRDLMAAKATGKFPSEATRKKMSTAKKGRPVHNKEVAARVALGQIGRKQSNNRSGFVGVYLDKRRGRYVAEFKGKWIGSFASAEEASAAYQTKRAEALLSATVTGF